ncbi:MAG: MBL fold metallo-hydrolase [Proteobacteria bacterium]|nr:MBL fold metallo-hydrolase [Pseudomonadota bacterium]
MNTASKNKTLNMRQLFDQETWTHTYLLYDSENGEGILIDPVKEKVDRDLNLLKELNVTLKYVLETHVHADHITGAADLREKTGAEIYYGEKAGVPCADGLLADGEELKFGNYTVKALSTPGHTDGCTSYVLENMVFTGDALFIRGTGRTDFQQGSSEALYESINSKLFTLPEDTLVYPGHDYKGMWVSTIGEEKQHNPRVGGGKTLKEFIEIMDNLNLANPKKLDISVPANLKCGQTT